MRIYLGSKLEDKPRMREVAAMLEKLGLTVVSSWIHSAGETYGTPEEEAPWAVQCEREIRACDIFVVFADATVRGQGRGGHHIEFGMARILGKQIVCVGEPENLFHYLPGLTWVWDISELLQFAQDCQYIDWMGR